MITNENFNGYIYIDEQQHCCSITNQLVKIFYREVGEHDVEKKSIESKLVIDDFLYFISESKEPLLIRISQNIEDATNWELCVAFYTDCIIKIEPLSLEKDLEKDLFFDFICFNNGAVNVIHAPNVKYNKKTGKISIDVGGNKKVKNNIKMLKGDVNLEIYSAPKTVTQTGKNTKIDEIISYVNIEFKQKESIRELIKYEELFRDLCILLVGQQNTTFDTDIVLCDDSDNKCYAKVKFFYNYEDFCNKKFTNVIPLGKLLNKLSLVFEILNSDKERPYLDFLIDTNKNKNLITFDSLCYLLTSLEKEYDLIAAKKAKIKLVNELNRTIDDYLKKHPQRITLAENAKATVSHITLPLRDRIMWLFKKYKTKFPTYLYYSDLDIDKVQSFVKCRNAVQHAGIKKWNTDISNYYNTLRRLVYFAFFDRIGIKGKTIDYIIYQLFS